MYECPCSSAEKSTLLAKVEVAGSNPARGTTEWPPRLALRGPLLVILEA